MCVIFKFIRSKTNKAVVNTNGSNLELYTIMAEYDGAGFPLSYCILSTASAITQRKRTRALVEWGKCIRDQYNIQPSFALVDKDMAEIAMLRDGGVWVLKIVLC